MRLVGYAFFDSFGLYAYDMDGKLLWEKDLGDKRMRQEFGEGQTPVLHGNRIVVQWDHQGPSFIAALDKQTGDELWRTTAPGDRQLGHAAGRRAWTARAQVIATAMNKVRSYDLETGKVVWEGPGLTMNPIPSAVYEDGIAFLMSGFRGNKLRAIRLADAKGDITSTGAHAWSLEQDTPYVPSPLLYDGVVYFLKSNSGILSAYRREDRQAALPAAAARRRAERVRVAGRREGTRLFRRPGRHDAGDQAGAGLRSAREERAGRRVQCVAGAGRRRALPARLQVPVLDREPVRPGTEPG